MEPSSPKISISYRRNGWKNTTSSNSGENASTKTQLASSLGSTRVRRFLKDSRSLNEQQDTLDEENHNEDEFDESLEETVAPLNEGWTLSPRKIGSGYESFGVHRNAARPELSESINPWGSDKQSGGSPNVYGMDLELGSVAKLTRKNGLKTLVYSPPLEEEDILTPEISPKDISLGWNPVIVTNNNSSPLVYLGSPRLNNSPRNKIKKTHTWDEFPQAVQEACLKVNLDPKVMEIDMNILWKVARFVEHKHFPKKKKKRIHQPYANSLFLEATKCLIETPEHTKPMDKLFKAFEFDAKGGFGRVYKAKHKLNKSYQFVAVKKLPHNSPKQKEHNTCEMGFMAACRHNNIVNHITTYRVLQPDDKEELWIIMEYIEGGILSKAAKDHVLYDKQIAWITREILQGVNYLHSNNFAHRDLKSANVMLSIKGHVKIVDFGLCADFSEGPRREMLGSPFWIPPEMIQNKPHSLSVDIWSLGVILIELLLNKPPYAQSGLLCLYKVGTEGLLPLVPSLNSGTAAKDFITKCLQMKPEDRPTTEQLLEHRWLHQPKMDIGVKILFKQIFVNKGVDNILV